MSKVYFLCPDFKHPSGSTRTLYWYVHQLRNRGIDAWIVHEKPGFDLSWHGISVPITNWSVQSNFQLDDILVFTEIMLPIIQRLATVTLRKTLLALNWSSDYLQLKPDDNWANYGIQAVFTPSVTIANYVKWRMNIPVTIIPTYVNPQLYYYDSQVKQKLVSYMTRKGDDAAIVSHVLRKKDRLFEDFNWQELVDFSEPEYAEYLRKSAIYIPPSAKEGLNVSILEAMASGCLVVGYHGVGGKDFTIASGEEQNCILVENGNLLELGEVLEQVLTDWVANPQSFSSIIENAISTGQKYQDSELEIEKLVEFFNNLPPVENNTSIPENNKKNVSGVNSHTMKLIKKAAELKQKGKFKAAMLTYKKAINSNENIPELWFNYGNLQQKLNQLEDAIVTYQKAISLNNNFFEAHLNLANCLRDSQRLEAAIIHYRKAIDLNPSFTLTYRNLGLVLINLNRFKEAGELFASWLRIERNNLFAINGLGIALKNQGDYKKALQCFQKGVEVDPENADALNNTGSLLRMLHKYNEALPFLKKAIVANPKNYIAHANYIHTLLNLGRVSEAIQQADSLLDENPNLGGIELLRGFALVNQARIAEAMDSFEICWRLNKEEVLAVSNALFANLYSDDILPEQVLKNCLQWVSRLPKPPIKYSGWQMDSDPDRRLKIGYMGSDLRSHPVSFFFEPILTNHNSEEVETFCYHTGGIEDDTTKRLKEASNNWLECASWDNHRLAQKIHDDAIDILVDLSGHTSGNRCTVMRCKPAPIQILYIGFPSTSGLEEMDYLIGDNFVSPENYEHLYTEEILRLDDSFWCFNPIENAPSEGELPANKNGYITFGSFNNVPKLSPRTISLWSKVLKALPNSRLLIKALAFEDEVTRDYFYEQFTDLGIDSERVIIEKPTTPLDKFLETYNRVDITLDSFPYTGGTITCQSLWMGVPVITLRGQHFFSRMSYSFLCNVGLRDLTADTEEDYVTIAVELAEDLEYLSQLRASLRDKMLNSPVCDAQSTTNSLERLYRQVYQQRVNR